MRRPDGELGSIAPLVPIMGFVLLLLGGLVIDGARLLNARGRAVAYAEEAARAGAAALELNDQVLSSERPGQVREEVLNYCAALREDPDLAATMTYCDLDLDGGAPESAIERVSDDDDRQIVVRVRVKMQQPASLLGIIGVRSLDASGIGRARPFEGVDPEDVDSEPEPVEITPVPDSGPRDGFDVEPPPGAACPTVFPGPGEPPLPPPGPFGCPLPPIPPCPTVTPQPGDPPPPVRPPPPTAPVCPPVVPVVTPTPTPAPTPAPAPAGPPVTAGPVTP